MRKTALYDRIRFDLPPGAEAAHVRTPDGSQEDLLVFIHQPVDFSYDFHGYERVRPVGEVRRQARYTARMPGRHHLSATAGGQTLYEEDFEAEDTGLAGYVQVSAKDPRYFACSNDRGYVPIGLNSVGVDYDRLPAGNEHFVASEQLETTGMGQWRRWFEALSAAGGNYCRLWISNRYTQARTELMGVHDQVALSRFDAVMELARACGIRVKVCMEHWRTFSDAGHFAYKRYVDPDTGRQLLDENLWFNDPRWNDRWIQDVLPYVARYQNDPVVFAWELWNEIDCGNGSFEAVAGFTRRMLPRIKALSPHNLVVNSLGSFDEEWKQERQDVFRELPEMDFQQVHRYLDQGAPMPICHTDPVAFSIEAVARSSRPDKPCILTETGAVNDRHVGPFRYYASDHLGRIFHDVTYPALFCGAAGSGHIWHWNQYVETKNLFRHFAPLASAFEGVRVDEEGFVCDVLEHPQAWILRMTGKNTTLAYIRNKSDRWDYTLRDVQDPTLVTALRIKAGRNHAQAYWIMDEAPGAAVISGEEVELPAFAHGCVLKLWD